MHAVKYQTVVRSDHRLSIDLPANFPEGDAEVIILAKSESQDSTDRGESMKEFLDWLQTQPPTGRSKEEIDAQIAEERNSWGD